MQYINQPLVSEIRQKFCNVNTCPISGDRIFFENAGGALTLKSALETTAKFASIPDNQGRDNLASQALNDVIKNAKSDLSALFNTQSGEFFMGESGTELLFRLIRNAVVASPSGGSVVGTSLEHPASRSAAKKWSDEIQAGSVGINVPIPLPTYAHSFGGWKDSGFSETKAFGPTSIEFYTKTKSLTTRWPDPADSKVDLGFPRNDN